MANADLVQESGPERLEFKQQLFADIAAAAPAHALLASSSSGIVATLIAEKLDDEAAARMLIAHPFNPPQLMPLVEIVPGERTAESLDRIGDRLLPRAGQSSGPRAQGDPGFCRQSSTGSSAQRSF
ncbi:3-hydroxyacyl-CoA dehydrogenase NAD-binding domain-containing protein [Renibacterium salmoninarum]|uniref:3-hydroxyacyl-CoA dehydrogenase NAD-binding domain-containing protein n=1 Tax=Renibacterium salmoninarum TaxID=1646 RepID=UPI00227747DA|nr:3-hydroxyacyl-CoA dehydrogenase NAD-binding domain-containing protein [Renibacterium salmoninarum]